MSFFDYQYQDTLVMATISSCIIGYSSNMWSTTDKYFYFLSTSWSSSSTLNIASRSLASVEVCLVLGMAELLISQRLRSQELRNHVRFQHRYLEEAHLLSFSSLFSPLILKIFSSLSSNRYIHKPCLPLLRKGLLPNIKQNYWSHY